MVIIDYADYTNFQDSIKNNFIIDYADSTDYQDHLKNCFIIDYAGYADIQLYVKNNFITTSSPEQFLKKTLFLLPLIAKRCAGDKVEFHHRLH